MIPSPSRYEIEKHYADKVMNYPVLNNDSIKSKTLVRLLNYHCIVVEYVKDNSIALFKLVNNDRLTRTRNLDFGHNIYYDFELVDSVVWYEFMKCVTVPIVYVVEVERKHTETSKSRFILHDNKCVDVTSQHVIYPAVYQK